MHSRDAHHGLRRARLPSIARLMPLEERRERNPGLIKGRLTKALFEPLPPEELEAWYR